MFDDLGLDGGTPSAKETLRRARHDAKLAALRAELERAAAFEVTVAAEVTAPAAAEVAT